MEKDEPRWDEAPDADLIAELLTERYPIEKGERLRVEIDEPEHAALLTLDTERRLYRIRVEYLRGAKDRDPWLLIVDAVDSLFGTLIESNRAYRDLPTGDDVEFDGAFFRVRVEHEMPEMDRIADQILKRGEHPEEGD